MLIFILIYLFFASQFTFKFPTTRYNYFNYLAEAFLQGKLHLVSKPPQLLNLSYFNQKLFLYFPPAPAFVFMPFVYFFGRNFSDIFLTALVGGISCFVFYHVLNKLKKSDILNLKINQKTIKLLSLLFALGTNHFYLSCFGSVWWTTHVFAVFFLNCSLYFLFKFLNSPKKLFASLIAIFFSLAVLSRFTTVFGLIFIFLIFFKKYFLKNLSDKTVFIYFFAPILIIFCLFLVYNYLRFQSPFELGYKYQIYAEILDLNAKTFGRSSLIYLPFNLYYYLIHPFKIVKYFPFYKPYHNGNSLFLLTPITLLIFFNWKKGLKKIKQNKFFALTLIISMILILLPALLNFSPGGPQIGYRYALDFLPLLLIFLLFFVENFNSKTSLILLILSIYFGLTSFYIFKQNLIEY